MQVQPLLIQNIKTYSGVNKNHPNNVKSGEIAFMQFLRLDNGEKSVDTFLNFFRKVSNRYMSKTGENIEYASLVKDGKCNVVVDIPDANVAIFKKIAEDLGKE